MKEKTSEMKNGCHLEKEISKLSKNPIDSLSISYIQI